MASCHFFYMYFLFPDITTFLYEERGKMTEDKNLRKLEFYVQGLRNLFLFFEKVKEITKYTISGINTV